MSPVFYMFNDRERAFGIIEAICGARMHPNWFRIGGVAQDLPHGWDGMFRDFIGYFPPRLDEYDREVMRNRIFKARTKGVGSFTTEEAIEWGVTGPGLRACGFEWDFRKKQPYSGYEQFEFDIPTATHGDCYDRAVVRVEEMRQSLRIIEQCVNNMPAGPYKSDHPLATPPLKERTMHDIETLITHFLSVSWGPVIPPGEALGAIEATKGNNGYYLVSDGSTVSYRTRIRTPSFPHMQMLPLLCRGRMIPDLLAVLGAWISCWRTWTDEERSMLTPEERRRSRPSSRTIRTGRPSRIDALKIVQQHRGWVSDEACATSASCSRCRPPNWTASPRSTT